MNPKPTRISGEIQFRSNEYLIKKATPRKSARPPTHANIFTPMNCSQFMLGTVSRGGSLTGGSFGSIGMADGMGGGVAVGWGAVVRTGADALSKGVGAGVGGSGVLRKMVVSASH